MKSKTTPPPAKKEYGTAPGLTGRRPTMPTAPARRMVPGKASGGIGGAAVSDAMPRGLIGAVAPGLKQATPARSSGSPKSLQEMMAQQGQTASRVQNDMLRARGFQPLVGPYKKGGPVKPKPAASAKPPKASAPKMPAMPPRMERMMAGKPKMMSAGGAAKERKGEVGRPRGRGPGMKGGW